MKLQIVNLRSSTQQKHVKNLVFLQFSGPRHWYFQLHLPNEFEDNVDCPVGTFASPKGNRTLITADLHHTRWVQNIHSLFIATASGKPR